MKSIGILLVVIGVTATIIVSINHWQPIPYLINYYTKNTDHYSAGQVYGLTGLLFVLPGALFMMLGKMIEKRRKKK